jgi:hypothetical protein
VHRLESCSRREMLNTAKPWILSQRILLENLWGRGLLCLKYRLIFRRVWRYKGVIRISKSKKDREHNGQKKKDKRTNNDLQNIAHKTKDRVTRTTLKNEEELCYDDNLNTFSLLLLLISFLLYMYIDIIF